ncbi:hypothetical protein VNO77_20053 [Canavalia gladiata]|uniref:Uncharacterized protein n=1 Tax=Canavalia gladiata TaxID=3824 RepID=A0AAN9LNU4_CANGL
MYPYRPPRRLPLLCPSPIAPQNYRLLTSKVKRIGAQRNNDISNLEKSPGKESESQGDQIYNSSIRTWAFCLSPGINTCWSSHSSERFTPVTTYYGGSRFITNQDGVWMGSNIFGQATPSLLTVAVIEFSDIAFAVDSIPAIFDLKYLHPSIVVVLGFSGCKMTLDYFGIHVSTEASLGFLALSLTIGVVLSLVEKSD